MVEVIKADINIKAIAIKSYTVAGYKRTIMYTEDHRLIDVSRKKYGNTDISGIHVLETNVTIPHLDEEFAKHKRLYLVIDREIHEFEDSESLYNFLDLVMMQSGEVTRVTITYEL